MSGYPRAGRVQVDEHLHVPEQAVDLAREQGNQTWLDIVARSKFGQAANSPSGGNPPPEAKPAITTTVVKLDFDPDEPALRTKLAALIDEQRQTEAALRQASEAHERARYHVSAMQARHALYADLDSRIAQSVAMTLRDGTPGPDHSAAIAERNDARSALNAATEAEAMLLREHAEAAGAASSVRAAIERCIQQVLCTVGERIAIERKVLIAEVEAKLLQLRALAQSVASVTLGPETREQLFLDEQSAGYHKADDPMWRTWADALRAGPQAELMPCPST